MDTQETLGKYYDWITISPWKVSKPPITLPHFLCRWGTSRSTTEAQRITLARWHLHPLERPFGAGNSPSAPVQTWANLGHKEILQLGAPDKPVYFA